MKPRVWPPLGSARVAIVLAIAAAAFAGCGEEEPRRGRAHGEIVGIEMTKDGEAEVKVSIFNPHHEDADIQCDVQAGRDGVSMLLTIGAKSRKVVTSKLHRQKPNTSREDVTVGCWRRLEG